MTTYGSHSIIYNWSIKERDDRFPLILIQKVSKTLSDDQERKQVRSCQMSEEIFGPHQSGFDIDQSKISSNYKINQKSQQLSGHEN